MDSESFINWDFIIESIENESCVLFVGPRLYLDQEGNSLEDQLIDHADLRNPDHKLIKSFYEDVGLMLFRKENRKILFMHQVRNFYKNAYEPVEDILEKLVQIPFRIVVSLTPDDLLTQAFKKKGIPVNEDVFFKNRPHNSFIHPTKDFPFLYKLLGTLEKKGDESLILTHEDLHEYMESFFNGKSISEQFLSEIAESNALLFIGIPFDRWYMQLLLRLLKINEDRISTATTPLQNPKYAQFYEEQFGIEFVPDKGPEFIDQLFKKCEAEGILRKAGQLINIEEKLEGIKSCIIESELESAFLDMQELLKIYKPASNALLDMTQQQEAIYNSVKSEQRKGVLSNEDFTIANNKVIDALFDILKEIKAFLETI